MKPLTPLLLLFTLTANAQTLVDVENLTPHAVYAMNPAVMSNGDIVYSCWNGYGQRGVSHTSANQWWICGMDADGTNGRVVLGAHGSPHIKTREYLTDWVDSKRSGEGVTEFRALRGVVDMGGYYAVSNYYRANHLGKNGILLGWKPIEVEGATILNNVSEAEKWSTSNQPGSGRYIPSTLYAMTPYGQDQDMLVRFHKDGRAAGKAGDAAPLPNTTDWMYTHLRGNCYEGTLESQNNRKAMGGEPTCKKEIRVAYVPVVTNPFDKSQSETIACADESLHCWGARAIAPRELLLSGGNE